MFGRGKKIPIKHKGMDQVLDCLTKDQLWNEAEKEANNNNYVFVFEK